VLTGRNRQRLQLRAQDRLALEQRAHTGLAERGIELGAVV
jgi:hypothetical protein